MKKVKRSLSIILALLIIMASIPSSVIMAFASNNILPVKSVTFEPYKIIEHTGGYWKNGYNSNTGNYNKFYYYDTYSINPEFTITLEDGTTLTSNDDGYVYYNDQWSELSITAEQSAANPWGLGKHTVSAEIFGFETTFDVEIIKTPVKSIKLEPLKIIEHTNGYWTNGYNSNTGNYNKFYYYDTYSINPEFTITLEDGTTLTSNDDGYVYYNDQWSELSITAEQSAANPWGLGTHTVSVSILGFETSFDVEIIESPYVSIEVTSIEPVIENKDCYINSDGNVCYYIPNFLFEVTLNDGTSFTGTHYQDDIIEVSHNQHDNPWVVGGENNTFTITYVNVSTQVKIDLLPSPKFEYIEQNGGLLITGCNIFDETVEIPSEIEGKPVIGIVSLGGEIDKVKYLTIPDSIETIGEKAFNDWQSQLETITIGSGVKYIDYNMFAECENLTDIYISDNNANYCDIDGIVYNKQKNKLIVYPLGKGDEYTVPLTINNIDILNDEIYSSLNIIFPEGHSEFVTEDDITYTADMTKVVKCNPGKSGEYIMPDTVTEIAESAFNGCEELINVKVSKNVTSIVYASFAGCSSLNSIELPSGLKSIDNRAFDSCYSLTDIEIPNGVTYIGKLAFSSCESLENIAIPDTVTIIDNDAFTYCCALESVTLQEGALKTIGQYAFYYCENLTEVILPDSLTNLGNGAFYECTNLENVVFGSGLANIPSWAFYYCAMESIIIPENITKISEGAFSYCRDLTDVEFEGDNIEIGVSAFNGCSLKNLNLPNGTKSIEAFAFCNNNISTLKIPNSVTTITYESFSGCQNLSTIEIPDEVISMSGNAFNSTKWYNQQPAGSVYLNKVYYTYKGAMPQNTEINIKSGTTVVADYALQNQTNLTKLTLPEGLKTIGMAAFFDCSKITEINIPASVSRIDAFAFGKCTSLSAINVDPNNKYFMSIDGVLFNKDGTELIWCPKRSNSKYIVPDKVKVIKPGAFGCSGIDTLKITNTETVLEIASVGYSVLVVERFNDPYNIPLNDACKRIAVNIICPKGSLAYDYAKKHFFVATELVEHKIESSGPDNIVIDTTNDVIDESVEMIVSSVNIDNINVSVDENYDFNNAVVFDINLKKDGENVQPNGDVKVSIPVPEAFNGEKCAVFYIDDDGSITNMNAIYKNGFLVFTTNHFSMYAIVEENDETDSNGTYVADLQISAKNVAFAADYTMLFAVSAANYNAYSEVYIEVQKKLYDGETEYEQATLTETEMLNGMYAFRYKNFAAREIASEVKATVYAKDADGNVYYGPTLTYSMREYAENQIGKSKNAYFKTMMVDFLNYGAAAQNYFGYNTGDLANKNIDAYQDLATEEVDIENVKGGHTDTSHSIDITSFNLIFKSKLTMVFATGLTDAEKSVLEKKVSAKITYTNFEGQTVSENIALNDEARFVKQGGKWCILYDGIKGREMDKVVTVAIYDNSNGNRVSNTVTYSVNSYACSKLTNSNLKLVALVNTMARFGHANQEYNRNK